MTDQKIPAGQLLQQPFRAGLTMALYIPHILAKKILLVNSESLP